MKSSSSLAKLQMHDRRPFAEVAANHKNSKGSSTQRTALAGAAAEPMNSPQGGCRHSVFISQRKITHCRACGLFLPSSGFDAIRERDISFSNDVPYDEILASMIDRMRINRPHEKRPNYLKYRRILVDWMCEVGDIF